MLAVQTIELVVAKVVAPPPDMASARGGSDAHVVGGRSNRVANCSGSLPSAHSKRAGGDCNDQLITMPRVSVADVPILPFSLLQSKARPRALHGQNAKPGAGGQAPIAPWAANPSETSDGLFDANPSIATALIEVTLSANQILYDEEMAREL